MWNFYWYDYLIVVAVFIAAIYFLVSRPRMKSKAKVTAKQLQEKINTAKTSAEFILVYKEIRAHKSWYVFLFNNWCIAVAERAKELTPEPPENYEIPKEPGEKDFFDNLREVWFFVIEVYEPLNLTEKSILNSVMKKLLGFELVYMKGGF